MIRIVIGFILAVIVTRNAAAMSAPVALSCVLGAVLGFVACYYFGRRDKNIAVATAVATAVAAANASAEAHATAIAKSAVTLVLNGGNGAVAAVEYSDEQTSIDSRIERAIEQTRSQDFQHSDSRLTDTVPIK